MAEFNGGSGNDIYAGSEAADSIAGGAGADNLDGAGGDDRIYSGVQSPPYNLPYGELPFTAPVLDRGSEVDTLRGGDGSDRLFAGYGDNVDGGANGVYGNGDYLYLSFQGATSGVTADFRQASLTIGGGLITGVENISWVEGSNFDDVITDRGIGAYYTEYGTLWGMGGNDVLTAGYYTGSMYGGDGADILDGEYGDSLHILDGGDGADIIYGNTTVQRTYGGGGADTLYVKRGDAWGGDGADLIVLSQMAYSTKVYGEAGDDDIRGADLATAFLVGGDGADKLTGASEADYLFADDANYNASGPYLGYDLGLEYDQLFGLGGDDRLYAGYGDDVDGGAGSDTLHLSFGGLTNGLTFSTAGIFSNQPFMLGGGVIRNIEALAFLLGSEFNDNLTIITQTTVITVDGGGGDDVITADGSTVNAIGGAGNDRFVSGTADNTFDGGDGLDVAAYSGARAGYTITRAPSGMVTVTGAHGTDLLTNVEQVAFSDQTITVSNLPLTGNENGNSINGGSGPDTLLGLGGADFLSGQGGDDILNGGAGDDILNGDGGVDTAVFAGASSAYQVTKFSNRIEVRGPEGTDTLHEVERLQFSDQTVETSSIAMTGTAGSDLISGSVERDLIYGLEGNDTLYGNDGDDILTGGPGNDSINGGPGTDTAIFSGPRSSYVVYRLTTGDLTIDGPDGSDTGNSLEFLQFSDGVLRVADLPFSGTNFGDSIWGSDSDDIYFGRGGNDVIWGNGGNDTLTGGAGVDSLYGGAGSDTFVLQALSDIPYVAGQTVETINDFQQGIDHIDVRGLVNAGVVLVLSYVGSDTVLFGFVNYDDTPDGAMLIKGVHLSDSDFVGLETLPQVGADGPDILVGTPDADMLLGLDGDDVLGGNAGDDILIGGFGADTLTGGAGKDTFRDTAAALNGDTITDLAMGDRIVIADASLAGFSYQLSGSTLSYTGGSLTLTTRPAGTHFVAVTAVGGGVELRLEAATAAPGVFNADFNGDGRSDVFWRNDNGWISSWLGQGGGGFLGDSAVSGVVPTDWKVIGVGDFNGDGKSDLFWRNDNATVASWLSQAGGGFIQDAAVGGVVPTDWKITGIGDFNGDGKDDIFWRNDSGAITSWLGQGGGGFVGDSTVSGTVPTDWKVVTVGDFNGDGRSDLFWRSDSGGIAVWQGQAGGFVGAAAVSGTVANTWTVVGAGDFNGDGRSDLLWRNDTGEIAGWAGQADGGFASIPGVSGVVPNDWKIANIGDFNGDGRADIFWRNDTGQLASWLGKAGGGFNQDAAVGGAIPTDWWTI